MRKVDEPDNFSRDYTLDTCIDEARSSLERGEKGAINKLVMYLLERKHDDDIREAFEYASHFSEYNNPGLAIHLSRMYSRGIGVNTDLDRAIRYMKTAYRCGHPVAVGELVDLLLMRKKNYDVELANILINFLKKDSTDLYRTANVHRIPGSNIDNIIYNLSESANKGNTFAKNDLFYILQAKNEWRNSDELSYYTEENYKPSKYALLREGVYNPLNPLESLGSNTGNLAFFSAIEKLFNPDAVPIGYLKEKAPQYEKLIVTNLIWIRENADFSYLKKMLDCVDIPLVFMSVGLQSNNLKKDFKLHESVVDILKNTHEDSIIGVRGKYTESILNKYGIYNTQVIGCPSMYYWNDRNFKINNDSQFIKAAGNFRTFYGTLSGREAEFIRFLKKWDCQFVEQTKH